MRRDIGLHIRKSTASILACFLSVGFLAPIASGQAVLLQNVHVIDMENNRVLRNRSVLIEDGIIRAVDKPRKVHAPEGVQRIAGRGRFVMPGLTDAHYHVRSETELVSNVRYGVTTVFLMSGDARRLRFREEIKRGERIGPYIYTSGPLIDGNPPVWPTHSSVVATPEEASAEVNKQAQAGYDYIKVYNRLTAESLRAVIATARTRNLAVVGHIPRQVGAAGSLDLGMSMVAHVEELYFTFLGGPSDQQLREGVQPICNTERLPELIALLKRKGTFVTANISFSAALLKMVDAPQEIFGDPELRYLHPARRELWEREQFGRRPDLKLKLPRERVKYECSQKLLAGLNRAGVPILAGTDSSAPGLFPGKALVWELQELSKAGLSPFEALRTATVNPAAFAIQKIPGARKFGLVKPGWAGDLVVLRRNPLQTIDNLQTIEAVVLHGKYLPIEEIDKLRSDFPSTFAREDLR